MRIGHAALYPIEIIIILSSPEYNPCANHTDAFSFPFDISPNRYTLSTSYLKRAIHTANHVLEQLDEEWIPVIKSWKLNGALQGLNKAETAAKYGEEQLKIWRRSFDIQPPILAQADERNPALHPMYREVDPAILPLTESLKDTIVRAIPYYEETIRQDIWAGKRVLIAAHGNSLRALVKYLDHIYSMRRSIHSSDQPALWLYRAPSQFPQSAPHWRRG